MPAFDVNNNGIADAWERDKIVEHNSVYPGAPLTWSPALFADTGGDDEPAALGNRRTDGSYSHADTGDGLTVFQEYRGYEVDGGAGFTSTRHVRLSPALKELLVQVNEQDNMAMDVGTGSAANPSAFAAFSKMQTMQAVAQFYCHPTRGAGIDLYWVNRPFVPLVGPAIMGRSNAYRYTGDMVYTPKPGTTVLGNLNGSTWIGSDTEYKATVLLADYYATFPPANGAFRFMMEQNRDMQLSGFVLLLLTSRNAGISRQYNNAPYETYLQQPNAYTILSDNAPDAPHQQGSVINAVAISEESPFDSSKIGFGHYSANEFMDVLEYAVAHELFHILCGSEHNLNSPGTIFGSGPYLSTLNTPANEQSQINMKTRYGVTQ